MTRDDFLHFFEYDSDVNRKVLDRLRTLSSPEPPPIDLLAHLLAAKQIWMGRLRGKNAPVAIWPEADLDDCATLIEKNRTAYDRFLRALAADELRETIRYQNSKGIHFENTVQDVLLHVLLHGSYHRGQIAKAIREAGGTPVNTDYIFHIREPLD